MRAVLADPLTPPPRAERADRERGAQQGHGQTPTPPAIEDRDRPQRLRQPLEPRDARRLHQHQVARPRVGADVVERGVGVLVARDVVGLDPLAHARDGDRLGLRRRP